MSLKIDDIIESKAVNKNKDLFRMVNHKPLSKKDYGGNVSYITLDFLTADGNWVKPCFKIIKQVIGSKAKLPKEGGDIAKYVSIVITKMDRAQIEGGDYVKPDYSSDSPEEEKKKIYYALIRKML